MLIPVAAGARLLQVLRVLEQSGGTPVTSAELETLCGWSSQTIRKDISYLAPALAGEGEAESFGSGAGYCPERLIPAIRRALGLDRRRKFCVAGLGRLGSAFLNLDWSTSMSIQNASHSGHIPWAAIHGGLGGSEDGGLDGGGFELAAGFDSNVNRVEILKSPAPLFPAYKMAEVIRRFGIEIALLCVPAGEAQTCAEKLAASGIRGIVNFAPAALVLPPEVTVQNVYVIDQLRALAVKM